MAVRLKSIAGTARSPLAGAKTAGEVDLRKTARVTVLVRSRETLDARAQSWRGSLATRHYLSREDYCARHGAAAEDLDAIEAYAHRCDLTVERRDVAERRVILAGPLSALSDAFGVQLQRVRWRGNMHRVRRGPIRVPADLVGIIEDVKGFDDRPVATPHFRRLRSKGRSAATAPKSVTAPQVAKLYEFPPNTQGAGECIALIELGGGYKSADLAVYFKSLGLPVPLVSAVGVDGGANSPGGAADGEVMLDIEVAGAIAPQAKIAVYFAPNTDQGFIDAIKTAVHDAVRKPSVISISWGGPEENYTAQSLQNYEAAFQEAAALGITVLVAAGDNGSADVDPPDKKKRVDFPSSSPFVLSCGGTSLTANAAKTSIASETVWNDGAQGGATGGGVSAKFALPAWQSSAGVPKLGLKTGRGVPDVSGNADPETGYQVRVDGQNEVIGGTSAVAPLWAGLLALCNQRLGKPVGFINELLYETIPVSAAFRDITAGNNGAYPAKTGWDACTGLGSPHGTGLLAALQPRKAARTNSKA